VDVVAAIDSLLHQGLGEKEKNTKKAFEIVPAQSNVSEHCESCCWNEIGSSSSTSKKC
jgi:hypothetical protein